MPLELIISSLNFLILIGLCFFLKFYFPSYFSQKGKNLATKEDIQEITSKVEEVKSGFQKDFEKWKTELKLLSESRIKLKDEFNASLISFFELCITLLNEKCTVNFGEFPVFVDKGWSLHDYQNSMNELLVKIPIQYYKMFIYCPKSSKDEEIVEGARIVVEASAEFQKAFKKNFPKVKRAIKKECEAFGSEDYTLKVKDADKVVEEYYNATASSYNKFSASFTQYLMKLREHFASQGKSLMTDVILPRESK